MKIAVAAVLALSATPAAAERTIELVPTCVAIDPEHDELAEAARPHARLLLARALEREEVLVVEAGCTETVVLSHQRDGELVHVRVRTGSEQRTRLASLRDDMFEVYAGLARALHEVPAPRPRLAEVFEPAAEVPPAPIARRMFHVRLGAAILDGTGGLAYAAGVRSGRATAVDAAFTFVDAREGTRGPRSAGFRLQALRFANPDGDASLYAGGGGSLGLVTVDERDPGGGFALDGAIGIEWRRRAARRCSLEVGLTLPLYKVGDAYPMALALGFGIGM